jgi:ACR3 family arsenite efflux pump ArsB
MPLVQVAANDLIMLVAFAPIVMFLWESPTWWCLRRF